MKRSYSVFTTVLAALIASVLSPVAADQPTGTTAKWVEAMLDSRAAVLAKHQPQPEDVVTEELSGAAIKDLEIDISGWKEVWLVSLHRRATVIVGDPFVVDAKGKKTSFGSLPILSRGGSSGDPVENRIAKKRPLQIGDEQFRRGFAMPGVSFLQIKTDAKYDKLTLQAGSAPKGRDPVVLKVASSQPPELAAWIRLETRFPEQSEWWYRDNDWPVAWFVTDDPSDITAERQFVARRTGACKEFGKSLKEAYTTLVKEETPGGDRRYLEVYAKAMALSRPVEAIQATKRTIDALGAFGQRLKDGYAQLIAGPAAVDDPAWKTLDDEAQRLTAALRRVKLFDADALRRAVDDLSESYPERYTDGPAFLKRLVDIERRLESDTLDEVTVTAALKLKQEILFSNPLLDFDKLLVRKANDPGLTSNWTSNCSRKKGAFDNEIAVLSPVRPDGELTTLIHPPRDSFIGDIDLHWNAQKMLVTMLDEGGRWQVFEVGIDGQGLRQVTFGGDDFDNAEGCYLPDGAIIFGSTATMNGVPCVGGSAPVANFYRLEPDGETVRQVTFEQDRDWCPTVLGSGRVMYTRWEYTDAPHYFTRLLMTMNPDGTGQMSHYGSNSFWPNSLFYARPCPERPSRFVGVVSGHHGTSRAGELVLFDSDPGRREADGAVQRIPGWGQKVEPIIADRLVDKTWPKFLHPWPLSDKYFLVTCKLNASSPWGLYLVDVFDNLQPILEDGTYDFFEPVPLVSRPMPPVLTPRISPESDEAVVFLSDVYYGPGLKGVPRGTVKRLRVISYSYGYRNIGGHNRIGMESSWDTKRVLGTVPVHDDGSAMFRVPANTPITIQPLDERGQALQLMRSWMVAMPGEVLSCAGCHEDRNAVTPSRSVLAGLGSPARIEPWYGPARAFGFDREVQPVLDRYCAGCHDGTDPERPNFADKSKGPENYSNAYHAIHGYVRRPGPESDYHMFQPLEYHASTCELVQMLERGHHGVRLDREAWERLYCWIDLNVPFFGTWTEIAHASGNRLRNGEAIEPIAERHRELLQMYVGITTNVELDSQRPPLDRVEFVPPPEQNEAARDYPAIAGWPLTREAAVALQAAGGTTSKTVDLGDGLEVELVLIPAGRFVMGDRIGDEPLRAVEIERPFWMAKTETTNALFRRFFPQHDSRYIDQWWKDHTTPGYPANRPEQPVIRVSYSEAMTFCDKLSDATGLKFTLPTESQWEWACRAGTDAPISFGEADADFSAFANLADESVHQFVVKGVNPKPAKHQDYSAFIPHAPGMDDGEMTVSDVASYATNAWGLFDMHGNVSEWTTTNFAASEPRKVVRGGSWRDRPHRARSGFRLPYQPWQKVFNVGFRVVCEAE